MFRFWFIVLPLSLTTRGPVVDQTHLTIRIKAGHVYLTGSIAPNDAQRFFETVEHQKIEGLIVDSGGGSVEDALQIVTCIYQKNWPITVYGLCASSCANYFLAASPKVTVENGSLILMHGNARHLLGNLQRHEAADQAFTDYGKKIVPKEAVFFKKTGVDERLSYLSGNFAVANQAVWAPTQSELNCSGYHITGYTVPMERSDFYTTIDDSIQKPKLKCKG